MNQNPLVEELIESLKESQSIFKFTNNYQEITIRCPICGDSSKDKTHTHFYIRLPQDEVSPFLVYCHRCNYGGLLTLSILKDIINNSNSDFLNAFSQYQKRGLKYMNKKFRIRSSKPLINRSKKQYKEDEDKLQYLNDRLGTNLGFQDLRDYKIFLNLWTLLDDNQVDELNEKKEKIDTLDKNYMGFISADNKYAIMRNAYKNDLPRYRNYCIYNTPESNKFYIIPSEISLQQERIKLVITEGIFDILGVYIHLRDKVFGNDKNIIFSAACGKHYYKPIEYLMNLGFVDLDIHIFADYDTIDSKEIISIIRNLKKKPFMNLCTYTVYYNAISKDFGVPRDQIKLKVMKGL